MNPGIRMANLVKETTLNKLIVTHRNVQLMVHLRAGRLGLSVRPLVTVVFNNISVSVRTVPRPLMESLALATQVRLGTVALTSVQLMVYGNPGVSGARAAKPVEVVLADVTGLVVTLAPRHHMVGTVRDTPRKPRLVTQIFAQLTASGPYGDDSFPARKLVAVVTRYESGLVGITQWLHTGRPALVDR